MNLITKYEMVYPSCLDSVREYVRYTRFYNNMTGGFARKFKKSYPLDFKIQNIKYEGNDCDIWYYEYDMYKFETISHPRNRAYLKKYLPKWENLGYIKRCRKNLPSYSLVTGVQKDVWYDAIIFIKK